MGYTACQAATDDRVAEGNVGAGTGATVGKVLGPGRAMKSGLGSAAVSLSGGVIVGALVAVNAIGDIVDPQTGAILAGARRPGSDDFADTLMMMRGMLSQTDLPPAANTVIGVVATNAGLSKEEANKVAQMGQNGVARTVRPAHMMLDGDTLFALSTARQRADVNLVGAYAAEVVAQAVTRAVKAAERAGGLPAWRDVRPRG
jgi:L-aminopeptidase/D-esterase-like protein